MGQKRKTETNDDGSISVIDPQVVDFYVTNNDLTFPYLWHEPRFAPKSFRICLEVMFKELYQYDCEMILYGKPEAIAYAYAERVI